MTVLWYVLVMSILLSKISTFCTVFTSAIQLPNAVKAFLFYLHHSSSSLLLRSVFLNIPRFPPLCLFIPLICSSWIHNQTWKPKIAPFSPFFLYSSQVKTIVTKQLSISVSPSFLLYDYIILRSSFLHLPFSSFWCRSAVVLSSYLYLQSLTEDAFLLILQSAGIHKHAMTFTIS